MRHLIKFIFLIIVASSVGFAQEFPDELNELDDVTGVGNEREALLQSKELIAQKKHAEAYKLLTDIITRDPTVYYAYLLRSKARYGLKDYKGSIDDSKHLVNNAANVDSLSLFLAYHNLGATYNNLRDFKQAVYYSKIAKKRDSTDVRPYFNLTYSYLESKQLDSAYSELEGLLKIDPNDKRGYYGKGKIYLMKKEYQLAISQFDKAIALDSNYVWAYQNRGEAKRSLGDKEGCCQDWTKSYELGLTTIKPYLKKVCR
ncbi:hypothetical protein GCM10027592_56680 [Spirosoma flavus]